MLTTSFQHRRRKQPLFFSAAAEAAKPNFSADFRRTLQNTAARDLNLILIHKNVVSALPITVWFIRKKTTWLHTGCSGLVGGRV